MLPCFLFYRQGVEVVDRERCPSFPCAQSSRKGKEGRVLRSNGFGTLKGAQGCGLWLRRTESLRISIKRPNLHSSSCPSLFVGDPVAHPDLFECLRRPGDLIMTNTSPESRSSSNNNLSNSAGQPKLLAPISSSGLPVPSPICRPALPSDIAQLIS